MHLSPTPFIDYRKILFALICVIVTFATLFQQANAVEKLTESEIVTLISGKRVEGYHERKGFFFVRLYYADGTLVQNSERGSRSGTWHVDKNNRLCQRFAKSEAKCRTVTYEEGVYRLYKINNNGKRKLVYTYKSFSPIDEQNDSISKKIKEADQQCQEKVEACPGREAETTYTGSLGKRPRQAFKAAKTILIHVTKKCSDRSYVKEVSQLPFEADAQLYLISAGLRIVTDPKVADMIMEIKVQARTLTANFRDTTIPDMHSNIRATAGSDLSGEIVLELRNVNKVSTRKRSVNPIRRTFSGSAPVPNEMSMFDIGPRFNEAYHNSMYTDELLSLLRDIYGEIRATQIATAVSTTRTEKLRQQVSKLEAGLNNFLAENKEDLTVLQSYKEGVTLESDYLRDGWTLKDPTRGQVGVVHFKRYMGTNRYTLGFFYPYQDIFDTNFNPNLINSMMDETNSEYKIAVHRTQPSVVCDLTFNNNILVQKSCNAGYFPGAAKP
jgi:hypothetical protein